MKTQINKKLALNKKTIAPLGHQQMNGIHGGTLPTEMFCKTTRDYPCPTDPTYRTCEQTQEPYC